MLKSRRISALALSITFFSFLPLLAAPPDDRVPRYSDDGHGQERAALAEEILAQREQESGRPFDPTIRSIVLAALTHKPLADLREMKLTPAPLNVGDTSADLSYTPLTPCRIIDTRLGGGAIAAGTTRNFVVAGATGFAAQGGAASGCGVPVGATSVLINFTAVNPQGLGNLKGAAFPNAIPATGSIINYQALTPALNIANGLAFPICDPSVATCTSDMTLLANNAGTDLVADVLGYFSRFKKEQVRSFAASTFADSSFAGKTLTTTCTNVGVPVTITAPVAGRIHVEAHVELSVSHPGAAGASTDFNVFLNSHPATCTGTFGADGGGFLETASAASFYYRDVPLNLVLDVAAGSSTTIYLTGFAGNATDSGFVFGSQLVATFHPN